MKMTMSRHIAITVLMVLSLFALGITASGAETAEPFSDPVNGFSINVPAGWNRSAMSNNDSNTHLFVSPDQNIAVGITTYAGSGKNDMAALLSRFQQSAFAGSQQITEQAASLNGINGLLRAYRVQDPGGPVIVGAFAANSTARSYVVWHMISEAFYNARYPESDAILNTFAMNVQNPEKKKRNKRTQSASTGNGTKKAMKAAPPERHSVQSAPPAAASPPAVGRVRESVRYKRVDVTPEFTFEVPFSYSGSPDGNRIIYTSSDKSRAGLALVLQKMTRSKGGGHADLDTSVKTALAQLQKAPSANLLAKTPIEVDGRPGVWLELIYEGQDGQRRMAQVLTSDASTVYWLGLNGPLATFNAMVADLNHAVKTAHLSGQRAAATPRSPVLHQYRKMVVEDSRFEFAYPEKFALAQKAEGQTQWRDPNDTGSTIVMVIQTMGRDMGNSAASVFKGLSDQVSAAPQAQMISSGQTTVNGIPAYQLHFTLQQPTEKQHFKYVVLDISGPNVATVSFVGPASLLEDMDAHYAKLLETVRSVGTDTLPAKAAQPEKPATAAVYEEPKTPEETFHAIQAAIKNKNWGYLVHLLHSDTVELEMSRYFGVLAEENHVQTAGLSPRRAMLEVFRQVPQAGENKAFLAKAATITGTRKHQEDKVLVMAKYDSGGEQYLWMFKEDGNWRWHYK